MGKTYRHLLAAAALYPSATAVLPYLAAVSTDGLTGPGHLFLLEYVAPVAATAAVVWLTRPATLSSWLGVAGFAGWALLIGQAWRAFIHSMWGSC